MEQNYYLVLIGNITADFIVNQEGTKGPFPGAIGNVSGYLAKFLDDPNRITPVSKMGNDMYAGKLKEKLDELGINKSHIVAVEGESRTYGIDVTKPQAPVITRLKNADAVMKAPYGDISGLLQENKTVLYIHSRAILEQNPPWILEKIKEAKKSGGIVIYDDNIRPVTIKEMKGLEEEALEEVVNNTIEVYKQLDVLKINEGEAVFLTELYKKRIEIDDPSTKTLEDGDLYHVAKEIAENYGAKRIVITRGEKGSYILDTKENVGLMVPAVKPENYVNSLGAGDAFDAGLVAGYANGLTIYETAFLASVLGSFAVKEVSGFPEHLTKELIRDRIMEYSKSYKITREGIDNGEKIERGIDGIRLLKELGIRPTLRQRVAASFDRYFLKYFKNH
ncbi:carbohydrate kinase family protein [Candidatus Woesearchaeota archaeon]|nr:carbohydrate kinase family protein [Candidatus Woesearchaeota archaeon]